MPECYRAWRDSLYWMSRYLERAEHTARLVDVELQLWLDQSPEAGAGRWRFFTGGPAHARAVGPIDPTRLVDTLVFSRKNSSSIVSCIANRAGKPEARAGTVQFEMWEQPEPAVPGSDGCAAGGKPGC